MKELFAYSFGGVAMMFAQAPDPGIPDWLNSATQITGWGVLAWLVWHQNSRTTPKLIADFMTALDVLTTRVSADRDLDRKQNAMDRELDRKQNAELMTKIVDSHNYAWENLRERQHQVANNLNILSGKVEYMNESHRKQNGEEPTK
jgi:hypothetical protein